MQSEVSGLIEEQDRIAGVRGITPAGPIEVRANLVVGADGRNSVVRDCSGLAVQDLGAPTDALWMRLSKRAGDPVISLLADRGKLFVIFDRGDYLQCAFSILKGSAEELQRRGIEGFRSKIVEIAPFLHDRVAELRDWKDVKLLTVKVNRLRHWYRPRFRVHWRRGARYVTGGRYRDQSGHPGRGCYGQHIGGTPSKRQPERHRSRQNTTTASIPDARHATVAGGDS